LTFDTTVLASEPLEVRPDRSQQIAGAAIVEEEDTLTDSPQRCGPELISARVTL